MHPRNQSEQALAGQVDWSHDSVLRILQNVEEPVGGLIRAFPGRSRLSDEPKWLECWFIELAQRFLDGADLHLKSIVETAAENEVLPFLAREPVESQLRLVALRPHWFRGFRKVPEPIRFEADLIVVEGRNSSGKTSISEAIEWVFTGQLSRRTSGGHGHPAELADCIANEFRPSDETTSVELTIMSEGNLLVLKRLLTRDYSSVAAEVPESDLLVDGEPVSKEAEQDLLDRLLAGVHPILMQHNLRRFVHDAPSSRREYFERLLQIDELTALIEKAVVGKKRVQEIPNPSGGTGLAALRDLANEVQDDHAAKGAEVAKALRKIESAEIGDVQGEMTASLIALANALFADDILGASRLSEYREGIEEAQSRQRESRLPILALMEVARKRPAPSAASLEKIVDELEAALAAVATAKEAAREIEEAQRDIARAVDQLIQANLIDPESKDNQKCPVCEDGDLTPNRLGDVVSWAPLARAVDGATVQRRTVAVKVRQEIDRLRQAVESSVPEPVKESEADQQLQSLPPQTGGLGKKALISAVQVRKRAAELVVTAERVKEELTAHEITVEGVALSTTKLRKALGAFNEPLASHREDVDALKEAVGDASRDDAMYRLREKWLKAASLTAAIEEDVAWEMAKAQASSALDGLREGLIDLRTEIIEDARLIFTAEMTAVWALLREDSGARFSELHVPPAKGKGFKLQLELKAVISDGKVDSEVDALRVFSESQVNVVGIAAYVTRAKRLGHKLLIFDDPVQSMDEEHFRSFAANLLPALVESGHQVVILTHSNTFSERLHEHHYMRDSYATLSTRFSKRTGCCVDEGNRRVTERLKLAEKAADEGHLKKAWNLVRLALERMYLLVKVKSDESFKPESWRNHAAENMWDEGVGEIIEKAAPGRAARLKEILKSTVAGAHDKPATSETDLKRAVKDLRALLDPLRLGDG